MICKNEYLKGRIKSDKKKKNSYFKVSKVFYSIYVVNIVLGREKEK